MKRSLRLHTFLKTFLFLVIFGFNAQSSFGQTTYNLITSTSDLTVGSKYLIVNRNTDGAGFAAGYQNTNNRPQASVTVSSLSISTTPATANTQTTTPFEFTLGGSSGAWTLFDPVNNGFLKATSSSSNNLQLTAPTGTWTISFSSGAAVMTCTNGGTRNLLRYNSGSSLFSCYTSGQAAVYLYKMAISGTASPTLSPDNTSNTVDNPIDITFTDDSTWRAAVTAVKIGTITLTSGTDYDLTDANLQLKPSGLNTLLTTSGSKSVIIEATGYTDATVTQIINAGVPTANSTAAISAALAPNTTRTITCTAKDQFNNLVSGYTFSYDVLITNNTSTTAESYTIDGSSFSATSTSGNPVVATTNTSGVATFDAVLPATIDSSDGISIQVQLNNDTTNIGSAFSFTQLASQTITFDALTPVTYGAGTFELTATASSTLPVSYESSNTAVATISGSTVTIVGAGSTNITASQSGNSSFNAAANVIQTLNVNAKELTLTDAAAASRAYNTLLTTNITGTLTGIINSDDVTLDGTLKGTFADANVADGIAVSSACILTGTKAGNYTLTQPTGLTANITQASQTITFGALANKTVGDANFNLTATATSSLAVTYSSSNESVATVSGSTVTIVGVGSTNITASQAGNTNYAAATDVVQSFTVTAAPIVAWQFGNPTSTGSEATYNATTNDANLNTVVLSRGAGITATGLGRAFSANAWAIGGTKSSAKTDNEYYQFVVNVKPGYKLNITGLDATLRRTSTGPNAYIWTYSTDGTNFTEIGTDVSFTNTADGVLQAPIDLSAIPALQNVENITNLTFRLYAWGSSSLTSTFAIGRYGVDITTNSLSISGTIDTATSTTWNGIAWTSGLPNTSLEAIIDATYNTNVGGVQGPFTAKKLTVTTNGNLTVNSETNITVQNDVINNGTLTIESNANLVQVNNVANTGNIIVKRNTNPLMRFDYVMWSSPVDGTQKLLDFSPLTSVSPTIRFYNYDSANNVYTSVLSPSTTEFVNATGYLIRLPFNHPTAPVAWTGTFSGVPNNGPISLESLTSGLYYATGNPYPSTIDADDFILTNGLTDALYFWRKTNGASGSAYATYTLAGGTAPSPGTLASPSSAIPNGTIQVGQGFIAKAFSTTLAFDNTMRITPNNDDQTFRSASSELPSTVERNRFWLNLSDATQTIGQTMVSYMTGATNGLDAQIDGKYINDSATALTSLIEGQEYAIQGKTLPFNASDVVPLGFKTETAGNYSISIFDKDGLFANNGQIIYLRDNLLNSVQNLNSGAYNFTSQAGVFNGRFDVIYQNALSTDVVDFTSNNVSIYNQNNVLNINSGNNTMSTVKVYDVLGRLLAQSNKINASQTQINIPATNQALIVQITSSEGIVVVKKVAN